MTWHYELLCDSCSFKRKPVNEQTSKEADDHEKFNLDHWVQLVQVLDAPNKTSRRERR